MFGEENYGFVLVACSKSRESELWAALVLMFIAVNIRRAVQSRIRIAALQKGVISNRYGFKET